MNFPKDQDTNRHRIKAFLGLQIATFVNNQYSPRKATTRYWCYTYASNLDAWFSTKGRVISPLIRSGEGGLLQLLRRAPGGACFELSFSGDVEGQILPWWHLEGGVGKGVLSSTRITDRDAKDSNTNHQATETVAAAMPWWSIDSHMEMVAKELSVSLRTADSQRTPRS